MDRGVLENNFKLEQGTVLGSLSIKNVFRNLSMKLTNNVNGNKTGIQWNYNALRKQKLFSHLTMGNNF